VNDLADAGLVSQRLREYEPIEGQQQLVVVTNLVGEDQANWDELSWAAPACGGYTFHSVKFGFQHTAIRWHLHFHVGCNSPFGCTGIAYAGGRRDLVIW
jgi:hypothetical protein